VSTDYKILDLIRANRIRPALSDMLHPSQYCGVSSNTIFGAVTTVRDAIAYGDLTRLSMHPFFGFHSSFWQDLAYLSTSDSKLLWL